MDQNSLLSVIILGVIEGLTEFLPVSSSGHLVLANYYLGWGEGLSLSVDIATNTGTLLAVLIYLRSDVLMALGGFFGGLRSAEGRTRPGWRLGLLVLAGSIPTAIIGLALSGMFERLNTPLPVAIALAITGLILWIAPKSGPKREVGQVTFRDAVVGGVVQGIAVIPGISRSGSTISALLGRGLDKELAPKLSFLMYLVVSLGVALLGIREFDGSIGIGPLLVMAAASFAVGYGALFVVFSLLRRGQFRVFSPYLWLLSAFTLVHLLVL